MKLVLHFPEEGVIRLGPDCYRCGLPISVGRVYALNLDETARHVLCTREDQVRRSAGDAMLARRAGRKRALRRWDVRIRALRCLYEEDLAELGRLRDRLYSR